MTSPPSNPKAAGAGGPPAAEAKRRFLVVDDNPDATSSLAMLLSLEGHEVRTARDGEEAVDLAQSWRPHVVLLDLGLPKLSGLEAARRIRREPWGKGMVLIAMTGRDEDEDRHASQEAGFDSHLVKPVDFAALMDLLDRRTGDS